MEHNSMQGTSSAVAFNVAGLITGHRVGERPFLTGQASVGGQTEVHSSILMSRPVPFNFPSFEEITKGSMRNATACSNIFELAKCALINHTHNCFQKAVREEVTATLGELKVVPERSLGRTIFVSICDHIRQWTIGNTIALLDMKLQSIYYGEILQIETEQVALLYNCEEVLDIQPAYAFTMVDTQLNAIFCLELSSILAWRKESSFLRKLWYGASECFGETRPCPTTTLRCPSPRTLNNLDRSQREAFYAAMSEQVALINAPSGSGAKMLLKTIVEHLCLNERFLSKLPLLLIVQNPLQLKEKLRWALSDVFNMNGEEMDEVTKAVQGSFEASMTLREIKTTTSRMHDLLLKMHDAETSISHQCSFEGIARAHSLLGNAAKNELRETLQHLATFTERYKQVRMESGACWSINQPVIMASPVTAVTHRSLLEILRPRVAIVFDAFEIEGFYGPALLPQSTEKVIFIGDSLSPRQASFSCCRRLFESGNFNVHELVFQYFQSQEVCDLLSPFLECKPNPWKPRQQVNGVRETVQFFNVPDIKEAACMISALCLHLEAHDYEPSDIAVLVLSSRHSAMKTLKQALRQQMGRRRVCTVRAFYPKRCKIAIMYLGSGSLGTQFAAALNRTRFAVYGFGDFSKTDESCQNVLNTAKEGNKHLFRGTLNLTCICHPDKDISVSSREDFETKLDGCGFCLEPSAF